MHGTQIVNNTIPDKFAPVTVHEYFIYSYVVGTNDQNSYVFGTNDQKIIIAFYEMPVDGLLS